jgi:hypothetical protein
MEKLTVHKEDPPIGYGWIGFFKTVHEVNEWINAAHKAGKNYPVWCQKKQLVAINPGEYTYTLFWKKPKNSKMVGKGFK